MKTNRRIVFACARAGVLIAALAFGCFVALAADKPAPAPPSGLGTNGVTLEAVIPPSIFNVTNQPTRDPFFPLSTRSPFPTATNSIVAVFTPSIFLLKGLSGLPGRQLALINNCTLSEGESGEVTTETGKFKITCLKIGEFSVTIHVPGHTEPIEIFLPNRAR